MSFCESVHPDTLPACMLGMKCREIESEGNSPLLSVDDTLRTHETASRQVLARLAIGCSVEACRKSVK